MIHRLSSFFPRSRFPKVPYKAREVLARLQRAGFVIKRQSGSHVDLRHPEWPADLCGHAHRGRSEGDLPQHSQAGEADGGGISQPLTCARSRNRSAFRRMKPVASFWSYAEAAPSMVAIFGS
ncbi:MAG: hypothetical protein DMF11_10965 [Verrucomicrobia bacterium]|nr:MAG: hypothetical protein DMF11_10965 [Verrucomicrobiota bacterium]